MGTEKEMRTLLLGRTAVNDRNEKREKGRGRGWKCLKSGKMVGAVMNNGIYRFQYYKNILKFGETKNFL
jgi:hypothetical protein